MHAINNFLSYSGSLVSISACARSPLRSMITHLPSVKNPTDNTLNESDVDCLKPTKFLVFPKSLLTLFCAALIDNRIEEWWGIRLEMQTG